MARRKRKPKPLTLAVAIQDRSGSMSARRDATIDGFNEYLDGLREDTDGDYAITLTQFDHTVERVYTAVPLDEVDDLDHETYCPRGSTRLYDAIGSTIKNVEKSADEFDHIIVLIMTDGEENSSTDFTRKQILTLMNRKRNLREGASWEFVFLGAGEDSWAAGDALGFKQSNSVYYGSVPTASAGAFRSATLATTARKNEGYGELDNFEFREAKSKTENTLGGRLTHTSKVIEKV